MAATIDNTTPTTQKGASNQAQSQHENQSSHGAGNNSRKARRISNFPKINRHKITWFLDSPALLALKGCGEGGAAEGALATAFFIDTHVEEKSALTAADSATSLNFHRYTFDMLRERKLPLKGGHYRVTPSQLGSQFE